MCLSRYVRYVTHVSWSRIYTNGFVRTPTPIVPLAKKYDFSKKPCDSYKFSTNGQLVLSRLVCHHFCSLAAQAVSRNSQWREVRLHLITGTPDDFIPRHSWIRIIVKVAWDMQNLFFFFFLLTFQRFSETFNLPVHILLLRCREKISV